MKKYMNQVTQWLAVFAVVITLIQTIVLPANAISIPPGQDFVGPICPQIEVSAAPGCSPYEFGVYSMEVIPQFPPITNRNFVPCAPGAIDSYFPAGGEQVRIMNMGYVAIEISPICD